MRPTLHCILRKSGLGLLLAASFQGMLAQDKIAQTPSLMQEGFGPGGYDLLGNGSAFCGPTTTTMSLAYLASAGFTQILPSNPTFADYLQLEQNIVGLSGASQLSGVLGGQLQTAVETFLAMKGISTGTFTEVSNPDVAWFTSQMPNPYASTFLNIGWYTLNSGTFTPGGGHFIGVVGTNLKAIGVSGSNYLVLDNPAPSTIFQVVDGTSSNPQFAHVIDFSGTIPGDDSPPVAQFDFHQDNTTLSGTYRALIQNGYTIAINPSDLPSQPGWTPATWVLSGSTPEINTGGGDLVVLAPIAGDHGLHKSGGGTLYLTGGSNTSTGTNTIINGGINSNQASGTPLGTGDIVLGSGTLTLQPAVSGSAAAISLTLASGPNHRLSYTAGGVLALNPNGNTGLTVTIGDAARTAEENFTGTSGGTFVIAPATGNASLGTTVKVLLAGSGTLHSRNGMISPAVVARDSNANGDGDFLSYDSSQGFTVAAYTLSTGTPINSGTDTTVYNAVSNQTLAADSEVKLSALRVQDSTISSGGGTTTLRVGSGVAGDYGGLILNNGQINTTDLTFEDAEGMIYTSQGGGTISSAIHTTAGLTLFGPGNLTLTANNAYTGGTRVQSGTLTIQSTVGSAVGSGTVTIGLGASVVVSGSLAKISGDTVVNGTLSVLDGKIGSVKVSEFANLQGYGHVTGRADINGSVGAFGTNVGTFVFEDAATFEGNSIFEWTLASLTDGGVPGHDWSSLEFTTTEEVKLGVSGGAPFSIDANFSLVDDPNSMNSFWDSSHSWLIIRSADVFADLNVYFGVPVFSQGYFEWDNNSTTDNGTEIWLYYTPTTAVPEPSAIALLALGAGLFLFVRKRRMSSVSAPGIDRA